MAFRAEMALLLALAWVGPALADEPAKPSVAEVVARVLPTVVSIQTINSVPGKPGKPSQAKATPDVQKSEGSGFFVDTSGFIATNRHVIEGAYNIGVTLFDGRVAQADVIWKSPVVDVAFLKIKTDRPVQAVTFADAATLKLGERVVAIGNPFGLGISVSSGVISAFNRNIKQSPYDDYIQTDAAINHGNSGGPLFDMAGDVVGMNSVLWQSGANSGSEGVGFAIPGADLTFLIDQLKTKGNVRCGLLGLHGQKLTPAMGDALGFPGYYGVIVASVDANGAAAKAGLRPGDVIRTFDGKTLYDVTTLNRMVCPAIGKTVALDVWRDRHSSTIDVKIADGQDTPEAEGEGHAAAPRFTSARDLGMTLAPVTDAIRRKYKLGKDMNGLAITAVTSTGVASDDGLVPGDVITSLQMNASPSAKAFDTMLLDYAREGRRHVIVMVQSTGGQRWVTFPVRLE